MYLLSSYLYVLAPGTQSIIVLALPAPAGANVIQNAGFADGLAKAGVKAGALICSFQPFVWLNVIFVRRLLRRRFGYLCLLLKLGSRDRIPLLRGCIPLLMFVMID